MIPRRKEEVEGRVEIGAEDSDADLFKITVRIINTSPLPAGYLDDPDAVLMRTFASTILRSRTASSSPSSTPQRLRQQPQLLVRISKLGLFSWEKKKAMTWMR